MTRRLPWAPRLKLVVICGSVSDEQRLLDAAHLYRMGHRDVIIPRRDDSVTTEMHAEEWERWLYNCKLAVVVRKPDGTLGTSVTREMEYARTLGVPINWYWPECEDHCPGCGWHQPPVPVPGPLGRVQCEECGVQWWMGKPERRTETPFPAWPGSRTRFPDLRRRKP